MLLDKWSDNVGVNIDQQIKEYGGNMKTLNRSDLSTPYEFKKNKQ